MTLLSVENLTISFHTRDGIVPAVSNISFSVNKGEVLGIVGESGSGKSVSCYSLLGLVPMPPGKIESGKAIFAGVDLFKINEKQLRSIRGKRISIIFQDPMTALNPFISIGKQIVESLRIHENIDNKNAKLRAIAALEEVGIRDATTRFNAYPHEFSGGMRQRVMIAMALATQPELLIADEPTTALDVTVQAQILALLKDLQKKYGLAIIFISHDLAVVKSLADKIIVMEKGLLVEEGAPKDVLNAPKQPYTQKLVNAIPKGKKESECLAIEDQPPLVEIKSLFKSFADRGASFFRSQNTRTSVLQNINLYIHQGEIFGLVGESGSGKSTLGRCILKLLDADSGQVLFEGNDLVPLKHKALFTRRRDFQMIFQDPYASLNPRMTIFDTLAEPLLVHKLCKKTELNFKISELLYDVGLDENASRKYPHEFSGGQRQRIAIARAIALEPKLIIADEPVSALDVTIQAQILKLLIKLTKEKNLTMLFISHDLSVIRSVCDRVAVMQQGKIVEIEKTEVLFSSPKNDYTKELLAAIPKL